MACSSAINHVFLMAPSSRIDSGHRSRISSIHGARCIAATKYPAKPLKNCGEVETTTSARRVKRAAIVAATM